MTVEKLFDFFTVYTGKITGTDGPCIKTFKMSGYVPDKLQVKALYKNILNIRLCTGEIASTGLVF